MGVRNLRHGGSVMVLALRGVIWKEADEPVVKDPETT